MTHRIWAERVSVCAFLVLTTITAMPAFAATIFSTGNPDGLIATGARPASPGVLETETADDFILGQSAMITGATFTGLLRAGTPVSGRNSGITDVEIELYHVFPTDSTSPPDGRVVARANSPSDKDFAAFDQAAGDISVTATILNPQIHGLQFGGEPDQPQARSIHWRRRRGDRRGSALQCHFQYAFLRWRHRSRLLPSGSGSDRPVRDEFVYVAFGPKAHRGPGDAFQR